MRKWFEFKNQAETSADMYFYGDIVGNEFEKWNDDDACPKDVVNALRECEGKNLNIYINSGGGDVFGGVAIYNALKRHKCKKIVHIDGIAGSIASVIAIAGDEIIMPENAYMMIHKPWTNAFCVNSDDLRNIADTLDTLENGILNIYETKLSDDVEIETIKNMLSDETWLTGKEAKKYFKISVNDVVNAAACVSKCFKNYKKIPDEIKKQKSEKENNNDMLKQKLQIELDLLSV